MNETDLYIRCPTCRTVFRTRDSMLQLQSGKVRCGQCRMVFDGRSNLVEVAFDDGFSDDPQIARDHAEEVAAARSTVPPETASGVAGFEDEAPPTVTAIAAPVDADVEHEPIEITAPPDAEPEDTAASGDTLSRTPYPEIGMDDPLGIATIPALNGPVTVSGPSTRARFGDPGPPTSSGAGSRVGGYVDTNARFGPATVGRAAATDPKMRDDAVVMPEWKGPAPAPRGRARWIYGLLALLMLGALAAQALFHYRNVIAADYPVTRRHLVAGCAMLGCRIEPLRNRDEIAIESHDLQADPAHQGLLILQTTLRNSSRHALAFPHLELELDDNAGQPIVRRVFTPLEYAGGAADFALGIPANAEWNVKLFLDASSVPAGGYHLYHFYP